MSRIKALVGTLCDQTKLSALIVDLCEEIDRLHEKNSRLAHEAARVEYYKTQHDKHVQDWVQSDRELIAAWESILGRKLRRDGAAYTQADLIRWGQEAAEVIKRAKVMIRARKTRP
jgi:hypothetical protein